LLFRWKKWSSSRKHGENLSGLREKAVFTVSEEGTAMNVPIRMLGIATSIFWIMLIAFIALAAYSVKDLNFNFGDPQFTTAPGGQLVFSLPLYIDNRGYYSLKEFQLSTVFRDAEGAEISRANTYVPVIPHGENITIMHNVTLSTASLLENGEQYLFNDSNLNVSVTAGLNFAELLPAQMSTNFTFPWGAPFYNFALGAPSYGRFDSAHGAVTVPMSFENHAVFDVAGNISIELYDSVGSLLGESQTVVDVPQGSSYAGSVAFQVPLNAASLSTARNGHFNVYFDTGFFTYGPLVIPYG
jgi:hypothetical protein